jgi:hypothetical protein
MRVELSFISIIFTCLYLGSHSVSSYVSVPFPCMKPRRTLSRLKEMTSNKDFEKRKAEIKRKIDELKRAGKLNRSTPTNNPEGEDLNLTLNPENLSGIERLKAQREQLKRKGSVMDQYSDRLKEKLGKRARYLGVDLGNKKDPLMPKRQGTLGSLDIDPVQKQKGDDSIEAIDDVDLLDDDDDDEDEEDELDQKLVDLVAEKLREKRAKERQEEEERLKLKLEKFREEREKQEEILNKNSTDQSEMVAPTTTGIGGSYTPNETAKEELRRPSRGSWGYFERPNDISKAYGGGRRVGAGYMKESDREASYEQTRQRMREYRIRMGIDVPSETEHAAEIEEAVKIAKLAMERGIYNTAVSALEKVTQWCSSNSKVGSQVFLELAMAYEAVGRMDEASQVYNKLTTCRIEEVKNNAKRLLYGLESFEFMKSEAQLASFNRKQIRMNFIETTRMDNFLSNFDDVYNTAYIDTSSREYKRLTENVVRSVREARQILLKATNSGLIERTKVIQALRSIARRFDEALKKEKQAAIEASQPVAVIDGVAIVSRKKDDTSKGEFNLATAEQTLENLNGEWRLQLIADRTGDGVRFYNSSLAWQTINMKDLAFTSQGLAGFLSFNEKGKLEFEKEKRILRRFSIESLGGGGVMAGLLAPKGGAMSNKVAQQILIVDSILLITRCAETPKWHDEDKEHFAVWRRVDAGTFTIN